MSKCGTPQGRGVHRRLGEPPCDPCRVAWNDYMRGRQKAARERGWVRPDREAPKTRYSVGECSTCGKTLARSALGDPLCALCRGNQPGYNIAVSRESRLEIYARDSWVCQLCQSPVDQTVDPRTRWGATLDHIQPRSLGGSDDPSNLRLAHRRCNSVRGARVELVPSNA